MVSVTVDRSRVEGPGRYEARLPVSSNGGSDTILIRLEIKESGGGTGGGEDGQQAVLTVLPDSVDFGTQETEKQVTARNTGTAAGTWTISPRYTGPAGGWLTVNPEMLTLPAQDNETVVFLASRQSLSPGSYSASVDFIPEGFTTPDAVVTVTMQVPSASAEGTPVLALENSFVWVGGRTTSAETTLSNSGTGTLTWSVGEIQYSGQVSGWLSVEPASGSLGPAQSAVVICRVDRSKVRRFGLYRAAVPIVSNGGTKTITVVMWNPLFGR